jgi:hypothetical protein
MAPALDVADFEAEEASKLAEMYPQHAAEILTF